MPSVSGIFFRRETTKYLKIPSQDKIPSQEKGTPSKMRSTFEGKNLFRKEFVPRGVNPFMN